MSRNLHQERRVWDKYTYKQLREKVNLGSSYHSTTCIKVQVKDQMKR